MTIAYHATPFDIHHAEFTKMPPAKQPITISHAPLLDAARKRPTEAEPQEQAPAPVQRVADLPLLPFSCVEPGCFRSGQYGFLRQVDLDEHMMVHTLLQGSMPYQLGPINPGALAMNNAFDQGQGYNYQQVMVLQPAANFVDDSSYGINIAREQENNFPQYISHGPTNCQAGYGMNNASGQENDFQPHTIYMSAGDVPQYGGFQMNGLDEYGNELNDELGPFV
ncbi:hypothetical protein F4860DRAFT_519718 [Xylaria cubensis]|nr:hypothetical protein F4860DRAFT_519718 [Xylaria cubensis]